MLIISQVNFSRPDFCKPTLGNIKPTSEDRVNTECLLPSCRPLLRMFPFSRHGLAILRNRPSDHLGQIVTSHPSRVIPVRREMRSVSLQSPRSLTASHLSVCVALGPHSGLRQWPQFPRRPLSLASQFLGQQLNDLESVVPLLLSLVSTSACVWSRRGAPVPRPSALAPRLPFARPQALMLSPACCTQSAGEADWAFVFPGRVHLPGCCSHKSPYSSVPLGPPNSLRYHLGQVPPCHCD
ncbi:uncharacterized protein LOC104876747 isoform X2 [Fukomys damarensis]|uniref:uncharacterized protein LOC104876747 isoform X2 n=1 Tax=Fukomys damarensis TaxID=885580 RepID=UPI00053FD513|nr:uncharacterized protein LOC104876747 isoform X2 [Fukomys damarensis]